MGSPREKSSEAMAVTHLFHLPDYDQIRINTFHLPTQRVHLPPNFLGSSTTLTTSTLCKTGCVLPPPCDIMNPYSSESAHARSVQEEPSALSSKVKIPPQPEPQPSILASQPGQQLSSPIFINPYNVINPYHSMSGYAQYMQEESAKQASKVKMSSQPALQPSSLATTDQDVRPRSCSINSINTVSDADWEVIGPLSPQMSPFEEVPPMSSKWVKEVQNPTLSSPPKSSETSLAKTQAFMKAQRADIQALDTALNQAQVFSKESAATCMPSTTVGLNTKILMPQPPAKQQASADVSKSTPNKHQAVSKQSYTYTYVLPDFVTDPKLWQELVLQDQRLNPDKQPVTSFQLAERRQVIAQQYLEKMKAQREADARLNRAAANAPNGPSPGRLSADIAQELAALGSHVHSGQGSISENQLLQRENLVIEYRKQRVLERDTDVLLNQGATKASNNPSATTSSTNLNLAIAQQIAQNREHDRQLMIAARTRRNNEATFAHAQGNDEAKKPMLEQTEASTTQNNAAPTTTMRVSQDRHKWRSAAALHDMPSTAVVIPQDQPRPRKWQRKIPTDLDSTHALHGMPPISAVDISQGQHPHLKRRQGSNNISTHDALTTLTREGTGVRAEIDRTEEEI